MAAHAREFAMALAEISIATQLAVKAQRLGTPVTQAVAQYWVAKLRPFTAHPGSWTQQRALLF
jgi:hypothetical protein